MLARRQLCFEGWALDDEEDLADELALEGLETGDAAAAKYLEARTRVMNADMSACISAISASGCIPRSKRSSG